jgi:hypothetical protein
MARATLDAHGKSIAAMYANFAHTSRSAATASSATRATKSIVVLRFMESGIADSSHDFKSSIARFVIRSRFVMVTPPPK